MKFYNPFKAHIVQTADGFFIRKFNIERLQWEYFDRTIDEWYYGAKAWRCGYINIANARHDLSKLKNKNKQKYIES